MEQVLIDGEWTDAIGSTDGFNAVNPRTGQALADTFPISGREDVELALEAGCRAARDLRGVPRDTIATFLFVFADRIEAAAGPLVEAAAIETALPSDPRLASIELPRTVDQLRQAAEATKDGTWTCATIDGSAGIRSMFRPLGGPVAVFGPNNFPFAFNSVRSSGRTISRSPSTPYLGAISRQPSLPETRSSPRQILRIR